jgi:tRNA pseudouridine38-40 synthase
VRFLFTVEYLGTAYAGWQTQANAQGVQQVIEAVLGTMFGTRIRIEGAGRTDSGVHARAQRAHADLPREMAPRGLMLGMNDLLPHDIRITAAERVDDDFHCRYRVKSKTYCYRVWNAAVADVFAYATHAHVAQPLDAARMHDAAQCVVGEHDFKSFTVLAPQVSSTVRTIESISVSREADVVTITVTANGFLRYMVRRIAGSLIEIGRGKLDAGALRRSLAPAFEPARWTAPAKGLTLWEINYC